jgi:DMSO/TMAO reductase YedYZ molybdopterin-dependent catalytic subunit
MLIVKVRKPITHYLCVKWKSDNFRLFGEVEEEKYLSYKEIMELPKTISSVNMHCVTTWSKFGTTFEGIALREFLKFVEINEGVKYIKIYGYYNGDRFDYSANLPLETLYTVGRIKIRIGMILIKNMAIH